MSKWQKVVSKKCKNEFKKDERVTKSCVEKCKSKFKNEYGFFTFNGSHFEFAT